MKTLIIMLSFLISANLNAEGSYLSDYEVLQLSKKFTSHAPRRITLKRRKFGRKGIRRSFSLQYKFTTFDGEMISPNPIDGSDYKSEFIYYKSRESGKKPLVILIPSIEGVTPIEPIVGQYLAKKGFNVMISLIPEDISDKTRPIHDTDNFLIRTSSAVRSLITYASGLPEVDNNKIGAMGVSLGGIRTLILMGVDKRIKASVVYVAGGDIPEIMTNSQQGIIKDYRKARMYESGLYAKDQYLDAYRRVSNIDPIHFARFIDNENIRIRIDMKDTSVPTENQLDMFKELDEPEDVKYYERGHVGTAATSMIHKRQIKDFFLDRFSRE